MSIQTICFTAILSLLRYARGLVCSITNLFFYFYFMITPQRGTYLWSGINKTIPSISTHNGLNKVQNLFYLRIFYQQGMFEELLRIRLQTILRP